MDPSWLSKKTAARYLDISERTLHALLKEGLPFAKLKSGTVRISKAALDTFMASHVVTQDRATQIANSVLKDMR